MHPFSTVTLGIFVAGYITARWDLVTRLYELVLFAAEYGVVVSRKGVRHAVWACLTCYLSFFESSCVQPAAWWS